MWLVFLIITIIISILIGICYILLDYLYNKIKQKKKLENFQTEKEIELAEKTLKDYY